MVASDWKCYNYFYRVLIILWWFEKINIAASIYYILGLFSHCIKWFTYVTQFVYNSTFFMGLGCTLMKISANSTDFYQFILLLLFFSHNTTKWFVYIMLCCACLFKLVAGVRPRPQFINCPLFKLLLTLEETCWIQNNTIGDKVRKKESIGYARVHKLLPNRKPKLKTISKLIV